MKKNILVVGPALSRSGYGEQTRFALRALKSREDLFNIFIIPTNWGGTGWVVESDEERKWIDERVMETQQRNQFGLSYDATLQVDIPWAPPPPNQPNVEPAGWKQFTDHDIGFTAGVETNKVSPQWIEKAQHVKKIIVVSEHSKNVYNDTVYVATDKSTGRQMSISNKTPIDAVGYPVREIEAEDLDLELRHDFNFLVMSQWCRRKNMENTIKWFVEEFHDDEVGLVVKTNLVKNCLMDRTRTAKSISSIIKNYPDRKCSVTLVHGNMSENEIAGLYKHPKITAFLSLAHGEGFGIPIFDAAINELPVVTPAWGGPLDFIVMPDKKGRNSIPVARVEFTMGQIQPDAVWDGVLQKDSMWCYPDEDSAKAKMRDVFRRYSKYKSKAVELSKFLKNKFTEENQYAKFVDALDIDFSEVEEDFNVDSWLDNIDAMEFE